MAVRRLGPSAGGHERDEERIKGAPMTMHDFEARHWIIAAVIIVLAVGAFAYSWS